MTLSICLLGLGACTQTPSLSFTDETAARSLSTGVEPEHSSEPAEPVEPEEANAFSDLACEMTPGTGCDIVLGPECSIKDGKEPCGIGFRWYGEGGDLAIDERGKPVGRLAGKTICVPAGVHHQMWFLGMQGTAQAPIKITNCGGQAILRSNGGSSISFEESRYLHLTGTGSTAHQYGIVAHSRGGGHGIGAQNGTSDLEIDHIEVKGDPVTYDSSGRAILTGNSGIAFHTYPRCSDGKYQRGTWTQYNSLIHDNYVHDTRYEGMYIGTSHTGWVSVGGSRPGWSCSDGNGGQYQLIEADVINVEVINNRIENTGNDALQIGGSLERTIVKGNRIYNYALNKTEFHSAGIQIGGGTRGIIDSNWIENPPPARISQGIKHGGLGDTYYLNNVIIGVSNGFQLLGNSDVAHGMNLPNTYIYNNTVIESDREALYVFCANMKTVIMKNNLFAGYMTPYASGNGYFSCLQGHDADENPNPFETQNLFFENINSAAFVDPASGNFRLRANSPAANGGTVVEKVELDHDGHPRAGSPYDLGAYDFR